MLSRASDIVKRLLEFISQPNKTDREISQIKANTMQRLANIKTELRQHRQGDTTKILLKTLGGKNG